MGFNCGIVGLPNIGKSTLFNALTATAAAESANYPFCTIEPNIGRVGVPDIRLDKIASISGSQKIIPTQLEFVDIAGLVKGASKGEGLGNQFLGNIRNVDAIIHLLRCFEDSDITHVEGSVDPIRDLEIIETELQISDLDMLEKRVKALEKRAKSNDKEAGELLPVAKKALTCLEGGRPARDLLSELDAYETPLLHSLQLLTSKPVLYAANVLEEDAATGNAHSQKLKEYVLDKKAQMVTISAAIESEIAQLDSEEEKDAFLETMGLNEAGLHKIIREGYALLKLITFFTVGPKEARAWTIHINAKAPQAAGVIHTDFERGFIKADTIAYDDFIHLKGEQACKDAGKMRQEGKEYLVQDGDIFHFKFNV